MPPACPFRPFFYSIEKFKITIQKWFIKQINSIAAAAFFVFWGFIFFLGVYISFRHQTRPHHSPLV